MSKTANKDRRQALNTQYKQSLLFWALLYSIFFIYCRLKNYREIDDLPGHNQYKYYVHKRSIFLMGLNQRNIHLVHIWKAQLKTREKQPT